MPECFNRWCVTAKQKVFLKFQHIVYTPCSSSAIQSTLSACLALFNINPFESFKEPYGFQKQ